MLAGNLANLEIVTMEAFATGMVGYMTIQAVRYSLLWVEDPTTSRVMAAFLYGVVASYGYWTL